MMGWVHEHWRGLYAALLGVLTFFYEGSGRPHAWYWTLLGLVVWLVFGVAVVRVLVASQRGFGRRR